MRLCLILLALLIVSFDISADCVPTSQITSATDSGASCSSVWKRETRVVTFPDFAEQSITVSGSGICMNTQDYCCAPYQYVSKCWPLFFDPEVGDGFWQQDVYTGILVAYRSQCQDPACGELVRDGAVKTQKGAHRNDFEFQAEQDSIRVLTSPAAGGAWTCAAVAKPELVIQAAIRAATVRY